MNIYAANLSNDVSSKDIRRAFEVFGKVIDVLLTRRRLTGISRGIAFVEMADHAEGLAAILELDCILLRGQAMVVGEVHAGMAVWTTPSTEKIPSI